MAKSKHKDPIRAKEARQKKILAVLLVALVGIGVYQVPKLSTKNTGQVSGGPVDIPSAVHGPPGAVPTAVPAAPTSTTSSSAPAPPTTSSPTGATVTPANAQLVDTDTPPTASDGQLVSFGLFQSKDPFVQQVDPHAASVPAPTPADTHKADVPPKTPPTGGSVTPAVPPAGGTTTTTVAPAPAVSITVNGQEERVAKGGTFPKASPVFRLDSWTRTTATISVVGGSYQDGAPAVTLTKGTPLTLMNTADGSRYRIVLVSTP